MTVTLPSYNNIIFDLGGVILNLDPQATVSKFNELGIQNVEYFYSDSYHDPFVLHFEMGKVSIPAFRDKIREISEVPLTDEAIDMAWNAMLGDIPEERIELLKQLRKKYRLYLLSNTNAIHIQHFNRYMKEVHGVDGMEALFDTCFYSSEIGFRKPDPRAFEYVLKEAHLNPHDTLFVDDFESNINVAAELGINVLHLEDHLDLLNVFSVYLE